MKSARQTLEDDKVTLQEYKIFITIIEIYKKVYIHCKNCYNNALIKNKFEVGKPKPYRGMQGKECKRKNCPNCHPRVKQKPVDPSGNDSKSEECNYSQEEANTKTNQGYKGGSQEAYDEDLDDYMDEEEEESSDDDIDPSYNITRVLPEELKAYKEMMDRILYKIRSNERVMK